MASICASGCQGINHADSGLRTGAVLGTVAGAVVGHQSGHGAEGALIGAAAGAITGNMIGEAQDERDAAIAHAQALEYAEPALTNNDLIYMAQNGLGDDVIINSVRSRGGRFDLSPNGLIQLRNAGVSDRVLVAVQQAGERPTVTTVSGSRPSSIVVVPSVGVVVGPRPVHVVPRGPYHRHHHRHGPHLHWW
ncbi:MAG: glycine zipper 2TM domain-containing protein [Planctomycetaceae bacterium]|nr:glycine zipper 2TM domain-containing protein [Planctomycetaceae bacterium]